MASALEVLTLVGVVPQFVAMASLFTNLLLGLSIDSKDNTNIRVALGQSEDLSQSFSGNLPGVALWDVNGAAIGHTDGSSKILAQGEFVDITVSPRVEVSNVPAIYMSITNGGNDAICISGIAVTFPDGSMGGFSTDIAAFCGAFWSYSLRPVVNTPPDAQSTPKCIWLDRDGSNGIPHQGMGFHIPSFANGNDNLARTFDDNNDLLCKSGPRFRMYPQLRTEQPILKFQHPLKFLKVDQTDDETLIGTDADPAFIIENPGVLTADQESGDIPETAAVGIKRRHRSTNSTVTGAAGPSGATGSDSANLANSTSRRDMAEYLIISPHTYHSARDLCESGSSFGHSWVSTADNLFCDMKDKSLYHTCGDEVTDCCLDVGTKSFRACKKSSVRPSIKMVNGVVVPSTSARFRDANGGSDPSWSKGRMTYDSDRVRTWS